MKLERDAAFETANRLYNEEHGSVETQKIPRCPSEHERMEHELTHIPYRDWCEFCIQCQAKSDSQGTPEEESGGRRGIPCIQMDFCYSKENPKDKTLVVLVVIDVWTKMVLSVPLESRGTQIKNTAEQIVRFSLGIGYYDQVEFVGDSEPTMIALLEQDDFLWQAL